LVLDLGFFKSWILKRRKVFGCSFHLPGPRKISPALFHVFWAGLEAALDYMEGEDGKQWW
jgi:hypothetical protein